MNQIWLRHRNGGGKIFGNNADIDPSAYLSRDSAIGDNVEVWGASRIYSSLLSDDVIASHSHIEHSTLFGHARVINSRVEDIELCDVRVWGDVVLIGPWSLSGAVRIHGGTWARPPHFAVISDANIQVVVSECHLPIAFHVGCWCRPWATWRSRGHAYGKVAGWSPGLVDEALAKMSEWRQDLENAAPVLRENPSHAPSVTENQQV